MTRPPIHGLMAEFETPAELVAAARSAHAAGYRHMDGYSPMPIEGLAEALGFRRNRLPMVVLIGGIIGGLLAFAAQYYYTVWGYPKNVGGRPFNSWPMYIPITFELTVLAASFCAVFGMLALNGLPMPYHPVFNVPRFALASRDRFFLCIEATDPRFDLAATRQFLDELQPREVTEVPH